MVVMAPEFSQDDLDADHLRSEVLAVLSHELSTPLAAIKGYVTAMLLEEVSWPEEKRRQFLQLITEEVDNLQTMISEILDTTRMEAGLLAIEPQPLRLPRLAQEVADEMQQRTMAHRFVLDFAPDFPLIDADPRRIKRVLRNLLDNAVKYAPDGGLVVLRGVVRANDVAISIADQGVGISPEDMIPLFDKYFRARSSPDNHVPGTGLGLPLSRAIVEAHNGRIWAESQLGEGTTLHFSLPRHGLSADVVANQSVELSSKKQKPKND
ncbi:MAG: ATP-binding protein [Chloroflexota bacterium]